MKPANCLKLILLSVSLATPWARATAVIQATPPHLSVLNSFSIFYDDLNGNQLFDMDELVSFSGFGTHGASYQEYYVKLISSPSIPGVSVSGMLEGAPSACAGNWCAKDMHYGGIGGQIWNPDAWMMARPQWFGYAVNGIPITLPPPVPEPNAAAMLLGGLGLLASVNAVSLICRRRRLTHPAAQPVLARPA